MDGGLVAVSHPVLVKSVVLRKGRCEKESHAGTPGKAEGTGKVSAHDTGATVTSLPQPSALHPSKNAVVYGGFMDRLCVGQLPASPEKISLMLVSTPPPH